MAEPTIKGLQKKLAALEEENAALRKENLLLQQKVDALVRRIFGSSSEPFNPNQPDLFGFTPAAEAQEAEKGCASFSGEASREKSDRRDRASASRPILERLGRAIKMLQPRFLPQSNMGKAIAHALSVWPSLQVYLTAGRVEIDNNVVENAIRPSAIGKKNWLFIGAAEAGKKTAILYTIVESCRRRGIDPLAYLHDVLTRIPRYTNHTVHELTPENWAKARAASQKQHAVAA